MPALRPRSVPPSSWRAWALEAFWLISERWYWHVPLALGLAGLGAWLPRLFQVVLGVVGLAVFALLAHATGQRRPLLGVLAAHAWALLRIALGWSAALLLAVFTLVTAVPGGGRTGSGGAATAGAGTAATPSALAFQAGADLLNTAGLALAGPGALFFLALLLFVQAPLLSAIDLSAEAVMRNRFVIPVGLALGGLLALAGWWSGLWVAGALPWAGAIVHVAFRDVFLHEAPPQRQHARASAPDMRQDRLPAG